MAAAALSTSSIVPVAAVVGTSNVKVRPASVSVAKAFGLRSGSPMGRVTCMATYNVTIITEDGEKITNAVPDDTYILDFFEEAGLDLPYSCRSGVCSSCAGIVEAGTVDQSDGDYLSAEQIADGFVLTCVARPTSDCTIAAHKEEDLN